MLHPSLRAEREAVAAFFAATAQRLATLRPLVGQSADIETLHDFRVELRRLRTVLRALRGDLPLQGTDQWIEDCRWLAATSSGLRDADVLQHRIGDYFGSHECAADARRTIERALARMRSRERSSAIRSLRSRRAERAVASLGALAELPASVPGWSARACLARACMKILKRFISDGLAIDAGSPVESLHDLRKRGKRLRYLLELCREVQPGRDFDAVLRRLRKLQNELGEFQDLATHERMLFALSEQFAAQSGVEALVVQMLEDLRDRGTGTRERAMRRFADLAGSKSLHRVSNLLGKSRRIIHPLVGTGGYCHGTDTGTAVELPVGKIVCVGRNYAAHAAELGNPVPEQPLLFIKPPSAAVDFGPQLRIPQDAGSVHHEIEIAVLIGRDLCHATPQQARAAIAGIGLAIDLTLRDEQDRLKASRQPWEIAKGFDGACALGPFVPPDPALDLQALDLRLSVNGRRRQSGSSAQMLTPVIDLLCFASRHFSLWPGDVLLTGTPSGVGPLKPGDRLSAELVGVSRQRAVVIG